MKKPEDRLLGVLNYVLEEYPVKDGDHETHFNTLANSIKDAEELKTELNQLRPLAKSYPKKFAEMSEEIKMYRKRLLEISEDPSSHFWREELRQLLEEYQ